MIILDTHVLLWLALKPERISKIAEEALRSARQNHDVVAVAGCSLYEFALTIARGRIGTNLPLDELMNEIPLRFAVLPLTAKVAMLAAQLPDTFPRDPFDRMIAATAILHRVPLVTADGAIRRSGVVATVW